jgi:hypothetical protein
MTWLQKATPILGVDRRRHHADDIGNKICTLIDGEACGFLKDYVEARRINVSELPGASRFVIDVKVSDPVSIGSDTRSIGLIWDNEVLQGKAKVDEGQTARFEINGVKGKDFLSIYCDDDTPIEVEVMTVAQAATKTEEEKRAQESDDDGGPFAAIKAIGKHIAQMQTIFIIGGLAVIGLVGYTIAKNSSVNVVK